MPEDLPSILGKCAVIGGSGFLGRHIMRQLQSAGVEAVALARHARPELSAPLVQGNILDLAGLTQALRGVRTVFHTASLCDIVRGTRPYWEINVTGSRNVLRACQEAGVSRLVYTSTPSVVVGREDILEGDETLPYASSFLSPYPETKAVAERELLAANGTSLRVCALRPHLIWGEDDPHILPVIVKMARRNALRIVGDGRNQVSLTHVENAAHAHLRAATELAGRARNAGKAYFVNDDAPVLLWSWIREFVERLGYPWRARRVSHGFAYVVGSLCELWSRLPGTGAPLFSRFLADQLAHSHTFRHNAATRDFGYQMVVSPAEGLEGIVRRFRRQS